MKILMKETNSFVRALLIISTICISALTSVAQVQKDWEKDGGIPNAEIEIVKDRKITLPPADRNFNKIPPRPAEVVKQDITYDYKNLKFNTPDFSPLVRPLKLKAEEISKIYGNYVSAGLGNYASPYGEAFFNSKRDKDKSYGIHLYHHSFGTGPVDKKNSASGSTDINLFGRATGRVVTADGQLDYQNTNGYFYGYKSGTATERNDIHQLYNTLSLGAGISNTKTSEFNYKLRGSYSYLEDHYKTSEGETNINGAGTYVISDAARATVQAEYFLIARKDSMVQHKARNLFKVKPAYLFMPVEKLWVTAGLNIAAEDDNGSKLHIYPNLRVDYALPGSVSAYAGLTGDVDKVSLHTLTRENFWVGSNLNIQHTNRQAELLAGIKGKVGSKVSFGTGFSVATLKNLYFFTNSVSDRAKFDVIYGNTTRLNIFGELGYSPGEDVKTSLRADYYGYTGNNIYHKPTYRLTFNSSYNIFSKLLLGVDFIGQGGMKTFDPEKLANVSIPAAVDLNAKVDYFFSRKVSAFLKFNNILSNNYQLYLHYPVRGFQAMGGITVSF